ncbi:hypothetical protein H5410_020416 [Solanum commersonii]|uniref:Uncharacterized protein n=1 Tax=Solanum commersonii TaxID=4109 RepID=A0A9J5ZB36_SOLCO|nr:hypothetical protein H5410_020416 [Solanum commersonii]
MLDKDNNATINKRLIEQLLEAAIFVSHGLIWTFFFEAFRWIPDLEPLFKLATSNSTLVIRD